MGGKASCESLQWGYDRLALQLYEAASQQPCLMPDVRIDSSLLMYSDINSNAVLQSYSDGLINQVPDYMAKLGTGLGKMKSIPSAVGLGALVISMIIEISMKSSAGKTEDSYSMFGRVFGEEKASGVRDTMSEYVKRHHMYMNDDRLLQMEIQRLEKQLSNHLTVLRNSLLHDGQMRSRGFNIWVNGASFHVQMLIHEARLNSQTGISTTDYVHTIQSAITTYLWDLNNLLEKYKTHMTSTADIYYDFRCGHPKYCLPSRCTIANDDKKCRKRYLECDSIDNVRTSCLKATYMNLVFSNSAPLSGLKNHFLNIKNNLTYHINQHDSFTLPSAR